MTTKMDVVAVHVKHPDWSAPEIAQELGCLTAYVRVIAQRCQLDLPRGISPKTMASETAARIRLQHVLGRAAMAAGLTVEAIEKLSRRKEAA